MIRPALIYLSAATLLLFTSCESDQPSKPHHRHPYGYNPDTQTQVVPDNTGTPAGTLTPDTTGSPDSGEIAPPPPPPPPTAPDNGAPATTGTSGAPGVARSDYPYGQPVPGKPGFVTSPYAQGTGYVDVRGFPPGTEVKDPYTGKVFLVP